MTAPSEESDSLDVEHEEARRFIAFSDAVVAIAITLLALDLPVPHLPDTASVHDILAFFRGHYAAYLSFLISFLVISSHWRAHRRVFRYVVRLDGTLEGLNMAWLLMMVLTPFAARLLASNGGFPIRFTIYAVIQVVSIFCLLRIDREVIRRGLLHPDTPESFRRRDTTPTVVMLVMFLVSIPVAFVTEWAYAVWAAVPLANWAVRRIRGSRRPAAQDGQP